MSVPIAENTYQSYAPPSQAPLDPEPAFYSRCNALCAVASSIAAAIAKSWVGKVEGIIKEAIKQNVKKLKYVANRSSSFNFFIQLFQGYMKECGDVRAIVKAFPWAVLSEKEQLFNYDLGLAMHKLLGSGPEFGFWAVEAPDENIARVVQKTRKRPLTYESWGRVLLSDKNFDEESGWKLPAEDTPWLTFGKDRTAPSFPPEFYHNWPSYYKWRGLPLKSPAALLLHWPLSMFRLLYLLGFVPTDPGRTERRKLTIHWLGVEVSSSIVF